MPPIVLYDVAALSIAALFYYYRDGIVLRMKREYELRKRVAYMLWNAANRD